MADPRCPSDPSHNGTVVNTNGIPKPHHAALLCEECHEHIKWLTKVDTRRYENAKNVPQISWCPFTNTTCVKQGCQLWWLCDSEGILAKVLTISWGDKDAD